MILYYHFHEVQIGAVLSQAEIDTLYIEFMMKSYCRLYEQEKQKHDVYFKISKQI